jgi:putative oxygen-independent coproporphyrinogen III oxidase
VYVYIHVPFCARRCSYCDFAIAVRRSVPSEAFADAILREWDARLHDAGWSTSLVVETVYFGGGTPSRLDDAALSRILARIRADRPVAADAEITLEANPDDVTAARADAWRAAGVNRISLGVQSFDPGVLEWMHRTHTAAQASEAVRALRAAGFADLSLDLIFGLPKALGREWAADLARARALEPDHLSCYGLTLEDHTPLARWQRRGEAVMVDEERYAKEFLELHQSLQDWGFEHYEVSNAARPGHRARHNSGYWRRVPYLGLGPSAHSATAEERRWNLREWTAYERAGREGREVVAGRERLDAGALRLEALYLGLRTAAGVDLELVKEEVRSRWENAGWAIAGPERFRLTPEGWLRLDALVAEAA